MMIREGGLDDPQVIALLRFHYETSRAVSPPCSTHVLDIGQLRAPGIRFWSAWEGDRLLGVGALKALSATHAEVKSMHVAGPARRRGAAAAILARISAEAAAMGVKRLSLETGAMDYFAPARALYARSGFVPCGPFEGYGEDRNSVYMTKLLGEGA